MGYYIKKPITSDDHPLDEHAYQQLADKFHKLDQKHNDGTKGLLQALFEDIFSDSDTDVGARDFDWGVEDDTAL